MRENWKSERVGAVDGKPAWVAKYRGPYGEWITLRTAFGTIKYMTPAAAENAGELFYRSHVNA